MAVTFFGYAIVPTTDDGTNTSDPTAITPPGSMAAGDLVVLWATCRTASATLAISQAGGQSWTALSSATSTNITSRLFWCRYNGTWSANPSVSFGATTCNSVSMLVFRPTTGTNLWALDQTESVAAFAAPGSPNYTVTITGQTTTHTSVAVAVWSTTDNNTWGSLSGTGWSKTSLPAQNRNSSGQDTSQTWAYKIQTGSGATNNVSQNQATLGGDLGVAGIACFYEYAPPIDIVPDQTGYNSQAGDEVTGLTQVHNIVPDQTAAQEQAGDEATLETIVDLVPDSTGYQTQAGDEAILEVIVPIDLVPDQEAYQTQGGDEATIETIVDIVPDQTAAQVQAGDTPTLETIVDMVPDSTGFQTQAGDEAVLETIVDMVPDQAAYQTQSGDEVTVTVEGGEGIDLVPAEGSQEQAGDEASLTQVHNIEAAEGAQVQAGDEAVLTQVHNLTADEGAQDQAGDEAPITQTHVLQPAEGSQDQAGDEATIYVVPAEEINLVTAEGSQDQAGGETSLIVGLLTKYEFVDRLLLEDRIAKARARREAEAVFLSPKVEEVRVRPRVERAWVHSKEKDVRIGRTK